jgi:hypothetical protein
MTPKAHMSTFVVDGISSIVSGAIYAGDVNPYNVWEFLIFSRSFFEIPKSPIRRISSPLGSLLINMLSGFKSL